ncbi:MAG: PAS domain-containing sensor histidine kinase [Bacteroidota bacterium]
MNSNTAYVTTSLEEELKETGLIRLMMDHVSDGVVVFDINLIVLACNKDAVKWSYLKEAEALGQPIFDVFPFLDNDLSRLSLKEALGGCETSMFEQNQDMVGDVGAVWVTAVPIRHEQGEIVGGLLTLKPNGKSTLNGSQTLPSSLENLVPNLSEESLSFSQEKLNSNEAHRQEVEGHLHHLTQELIRTNNDLEQFAYVLSHNFRAPVINLQSLLQLFNAKKLEDPVNTQIFDKIRISIKQLSETLHDLQKIVGLRNEAPRQEYINLAGYINKVCSLLKEQMLEAGAQIDIQVDDQIELFLPKAYLHSILHQLISNSLKYRSSERPLMLTFQTKYEEEFVKLLVIDNGIGLNHEKYKNRIFGLYQRFHEHIEGKGLGLFLVKTQIEIMGGKVEFESNVDQGTTVHIYFKKL